MSSAREDLDQFHRFAAERLASGEATVSLDDLYTEWHDRHSQDDVNRAISQGLADIDAGRYQLAEKVMENIRREFGFGQP